MRTPGNDEELAAGFMTSEGFTISKADFREIDRCPLSSNPENTIRIRFGDKVDEKSIESRRYIAPCPPAVAFAEKLRSRQLEARFPKSKAT